MSVTPEHSKFRHIICLRRLYHPFSSCTHHQSFRQSLPLARYPTSSPHRSRYHCFSRSVAITKPILLSLLIQNTRELRKCTCRFFFFSHSLPFAFCLPQYRGRGVPVVKCTILREECMSFRKRQFLTSKAARWDLLQCLN